MEMGVLILKVRRDEHSLSIRSHVSSEFQLRGRSGREDLHA